MRLYRYARVSNSLIMTDCFIYFAVIKLASLYLKCRVAILVARVLTTLKGKPLLLVNVIVCLEPEGH